MAAGTAARTGRRASSLCRTEFAADAARGHSTRRSTDRAVLVSLSMGAQRSLVLAARHPERVAGTRLHRAIIALAERPPGADGLVRRPLDTDEGWEKYNGMSGDATTAASWSSSSAGASPSRTRRADRGLRRLGARDGRRHPAPDPRQPNGSTRPRSVPSARAIDARSWSSTATRTRSPADARRTSSPRRAPAPPRHDRRRRPHPAMPATRLWSTCSSATSSRRSGTPP